MDQTFLVAVGKVRRAHGILGALKLFPYGETLRGMKVGEKLLSGEGHKRRDLTISNLRIATAIEMIVQFEEIGNREEADTFRGLELFVDKSRLAALPPDEYYHFQLIGLSVESKEGKLLGTLDSILETGSHDVYVVEHAGKEVLVPAIEDFVIKVDLLNGKLIVDLPEGLE